MIDWTLIEILDKLLYESDLKYLTSTLEELTVTEELTNLALLPPPSGPFY